MSVRPPQPAIAVLAVEPSSSCARRVEAHFPCLYARPEALELGAALREGRSRAAAQRGVLVAVLPASRPELFLAAAVVGADRIAALHETTEDEPPLEATAMRAAYALVDLTIAVDAEAERAAIRAGSDPERTVQLTDEMVDRLVLEPRRRPRSQAFMEVAASLALDAAALTGALKILELLTPDKGVNVVNYHRVLPLEELVGYCRPQMAIAEPIFEAQLDTISRVRGFTRIDRVREDSAAGRVAITFDDGYEDNFRVALPILQRFSTPACIFIVTNLIGRPDALWWDRLGLALFVYWRDGCALAPPAELPAVVGRLRETQAFGEARAIISAVISEYNGRPHEDRVRAVAAAEALVPKLAACRTMLSWEEVEKMARLGIHFGGHTKNHVPLDEVPADTAIEELFGSQRDLEARIPVAQPRVLALPRGRLGELSERNMRDGGAVGVMTSATGVNRPDDPSLFVLRRDGRMLTLHGRHHPAKLRLELTGLVDRLRRALHQPIAKGYDDAHAGEG